MICSPYLFILIKVFPFSSVIGNGEVVGAWFQPNEATKVCI
jgi:hypothetical protein